MKIRVIKTDKNDVILDIKESMPIGVRKNGRLDGRSERFLREMVVDLSNKDKEEKIFLERVTDDGKWF